MAISQVVAAVAKVVDAEFEEDGSKKKKKVFKDVSVLQEGDKIILPEGMDFDEGIKWLQRKQVEELREVAINEQIDAFPLDGALAFHKAIARKYGFAGLIPTPGFWGPRPPVMIGVNVSPKTTVQVPWGRLEIPNIKGFLQTQVDQKDGRHVFVIGGAVLQKHKKEISELAQATRDIVREESIYRGKAIKVSFPELNPHDFDPTSNPPKFIDTASVSSEELIFSDDVRLLVNDSLFVPIQKTALCRKYKIPLKRGILLEGPYGTGKTLTAYVTAKMAEENGWTFIYLNTVKDLQRAIFFGQQYGPAVIFAEDIDTVLKGGRNDEMNGILNTIDGVDTKGSELIVVLTTNHVNLINPAMLRPGRLDAVVPVRPPDAEAVARLIKLYARGLVEAGENLEEAGTLLNGHIPAVIREVVERSKLSAVGRLQDGQDMTLKGQDLVTAAKSMMAQIALINPNHKVEPHAMEILGTALGREMASGLITSAMGKEQFEKLLSPAVLAAMKAPHAALNGGSTNGKQ